jgi:hypothetical protein
LALEISLYTFLQILSVRPFEKTQISSAFLDIDDTFATTISSNLKFPRFCSDHMAANSL